MLPFTIPSILAGADVCIYRMFVYAIGCIPWADASARICLQLQVLMSASLGICTHFQPHLVSEVLPAALGIKPNQVFVCDPCLCQP